VNRYTWVGGLAALLVTAQALADEAPGRRVFSQWCEACHGVGEDRPGTLGLRAKYGGKLPALLEERKDLTPNEVKYYVRHGVAMMAPFRKTEITDADLDLLARYLAHSK
jgi:(+)-pinoresinol hydroxylase